jgi:MFS family permease
LMFTSTFSIGAFPALLPDIGRAAGLGDASLGALAGAFGFARMLADVPVGLFITHHLRRALLLSPAMLAVGVLGLASDGPFAVLLLSRIVMGFAHALGVVAGLTAILKYQTPGTLAAALSAFELSAMLGVLGGTAVLSGLPSRLAWNHALLITCAPQLVGLVLVPFALAALPIEPRATTQRLFARPELARGHAPITPAVVMAFAAGGIVAIAYATVEQFVIPLRGDRDFGLDRRGIARLLMIAQVCDIACLLPAGVLSDRRGVARVLGVLLLSFGLGVTLIAFGHFTLLVAGCVLYGAGMSGWTLPLSLLRSATPAAHVGWRTALYRVGVDGGMFLGPFLSGVLAGSYAGVLPALLAASLTVVGALLLRLEWTREPGAAAARR